MPKHEPRCTEPYTPSGIRLGPGHWQVDSDSAGQHLDLDLTLNDDGTLTGRYAAYRTTKDVTGDWHYDAMSDSTHLHINASFGSTSDQHMLRISLMSRSDGVITGQDALTIGLGICTYTIRRTPN